MDAPSLEGIGARRRSGWLAKWILDPHSLRPSARMPRLLSGPDAPAEAEAMAAYLASLTSGGEPKTLPAAYQTRQPTPGAEEGNAPAGGEPAPLYERLHCAGCHNPPNATQPDPAKLSQRGIAEKFPPGRLAELLRAPEAHYAWTRMPNFHLGEAEARELEEWLFAAAPKPQLAAVPSSPALIEKGRRLVQERGCLNCHQLPLENQFKSLPLARLQERAAAPGPAGCLGPQPPAHYGFSPEHRDALTAFLRSGFASLSRHVPAEFAARQVRDLQCASCHGELEGFPHLDLLGAKLKPEWMTRFIGGQIRHKIRFDNHPSGLPWLASRMPAFPARAGALATGLAAQAGFPARSAAEPPLDPVLAAAGHKLVGKDGGLSCVQCHAVGSFQAMDVFESEGVNLAWTAERLQPEFYGRWMRAPLSVDPQTKMPTYFEDGRSPLTDILEGSADRQILGLWHYLRQGDAMPRPRTGAE
jgi:mono/diheme cytochrome c family protein